MRRKAMKNRPNPDNRKDNARKIQKNINDTIQNMEAADEMIAHASNPKTRQELTDKNERREQALEGLRHEIRDETRDEKRGHKK